MSAGTRWIRAVQEMLRDEVITPQSELREDDIGSKCSPVRIHRQGKNLIISMNATVDGVCIKDRLFPLFRPIEGVARMCDYWMLVDLDDTMYVLLCELKSGKLSGLAQLENARLLAGYFISMVSHHQNVDQNDVKFRGIVFSPAYRNPKANIKPGKMVYVEQGKMKLKVALLNDRAQYSMTYFCV